MNDKNIMEMSRDVDDFLNKMVSFHGTNFAVVVATIFARLAVIAMKTHQEIGMMKLLGSMQNSLLKSLDASIREE